MKPLKLTDNLLITYQGKIHSLPVITVIDDHFMIIVDMVEGNEIELSDDAYDYYNKRFEHEVNLGNIIDPEE